MSSSSRVRVRVACNACKQRKLKCDGNIPACGNCAKNERSCIVKDPSTKRHLPPGYTAVLEERVAHLERLLKDRCPEIALDHMTPLPRSDHEDGTGTRSPSMPLESQPLPQNIWQNNMNAPGSSASVIPEATGNDQNLGTIPEDIEMLCVNSAIGQPRYMGPLSALGLSRVIGSVLGRIRFQGPGLTMGGINNDFLRDLPKSEPASLPDKLFGSFLSETYFTHVNPQYPFLHQPTFMEWENEVYYAIDNSMSADPTQLFFVNMVYAVGAAVSPAQSPCSAASLYAAAELLFEQVMQNSDLEFIQALLLCAMYSMRSSIGVSVWMLSGLALRHCVELGLHRNITWAEGITDINPLALEMRKRVFWVSYNIDRAAAMTLGRPISLQDSDINVDLPLDINDDEITSNGLTFEPRRLDTEPSRMMSPSLHFIQLRRIWASIQSLDNSSWTEHEEVNMTNSNHHHQTSEKIDQQLREWFEKAPIEPKPSTLFSGRDWLSLSYHHSILLLHRRRLIIGSNHPIAIQSHLKCAESAMQICRLYRGMYFTSTVSFTWSALHVLFLAGLTFLHSLWTSKEVREARRRDVVGTCTSCTIVLVIMGERWSVAQPYRDLFNLLADATQSMLSEPSDEGSRQLPAMRRSDHISIPGLLNEISGVGIDRSAEMLLNDMVG